MRWFGRGSGNIDDRRSGGGGMALGGGAGIVLVILGLIFGKDFTGLVSQVAPGATQQSGEMGTPEDADGKFVAGVLESTEIVWDDIFKQQGETYQKPTLVLFRDGVQSGCGNASASVGPFYCPADSKVYIDLAFYDDLKNRFGAPGDFAQAYVIAHEVGHHVQNLMGTSRKMEEARGRLSETEYNRLSVQVELQADFYAGVWAHYLEKMRGQNGERVVEVGDIDEALNAANAIGDDRLQKQAQGEVVPDSFTHGTSAQRVKWFRKGYETGDVSQGDTFNTQNL